MQIGGARRGNPMRWAVWGTAAFLWLLPMVAMQFTTEVDWDAADFAIIGAMLLAACGVYELGIWLSDSPAYRAGFGMAVVAAFLLVWINLAVGMIGAENNPANLLFGGVLAIGLAGAAIARFRPRGMAFTLVAMASTQAAIAGTALIAGWDELGAVLAGFFSLLWLASAALFRVSVDGALAARGQRLRVHAILSLLTLLMGVLLLATMVVVEGEPGLVPLLMVAVGATWFVAAWRRLGRACIGTG
jgi:hypothetical protein